MSGPFLFACSWRDDVGRTIGAERPEALAFIALEFFERRDLFLVSRESGQRIPQLRPGLIPAST